VRDLGSVSATGSDADEIYVGGYSEGPTIRGSRGDRVPILSKLVSTKASGDGVLKWARRFYFDEDGETWASAHHRFTSVTAIAGYSTDSLYVAIA